ncbi:hypothetical protein NQ317_005868 [Molorchus minor]|uniref:Uncharacterized protein n=1 Tax=Molorchus minor TaxID=1323400 RepID=A0ABQ9IWN1_9CUCU|nr:hypothetical protein NQ317_005868 [Molorchus minor]
MSIFVDTPFWQKPSICTKTLENIENIYCLFKGFLESCMKVNILCIWNFIKKESDEFIKSIGISRILSVRAGLSVLGKCCMCLAVILRIFKCLKTARSLALFTKKSLNPMIRYDMSPFIRRYAR